MEPTGPTTDIAAQTAERDAGVCASHAAILHQATLGAFADAVRHNAELRKTFGALVGAMLSGANVAECKNALDNEILKHFLPKGYFYYLRQDKQKQYPIYYTQRHIAMVHGMMPTVVSELSQFKREKCGPLMIDVNADNTVLFATMADFALDHLKEKSGILSR